MKTFEEFKTEILQRAKSVNACTSEYQKAYKAENFTELFAIIKNNFYYACENKIIDSELIESVKDNATKNDVFINVDVTSGFLLASGSATVEASGSATVEAWDSATVRAWDSATVRAWDSAFINVRSDMQCKISDKAIMLHRDTNEIVIIKGKFTIKEQEDEQ